MLTTETTLRILAQNIADKRLASAYFETPLISPLNANTAYTFRNPSLGGIYYRCETTKNAAREIVEVRTPLGEASLLYTRKDGQIIFSTYSKLGAIAKTMDTIEALQLAHEHDDDFQGVSVDCDELLAQYIFAQSLDALLRTKNSAKK